MVKTILTENSVQWFSDNDKEPFLEYFIESDELKIYDERLYFLEGIWIMPNVPSISIGIEYWIPENCPDSIKSVINTRIYNKRGDYNKRNYVFISNGLHRFGKLKTVMTENYIQWISNDCKEPFLKYNFKSDDLKIYDNDIYIFERFGALNIPMFGLSTSFSKYWYPENCSDSLKLIIHDIIHGIFFTNKEERNEIIKEIGYI